MTFFFVVLISGLIVFWLFWWANTPYKQTRNPSATTDRDAKLVANARNLIRIGEALIQAGLVGDQKTIDAINSRTYDGPLPERRNDGGWLSIYDNLRILKIAGINHRQGIERYIGRVECALVPEPKNEFDPDAIKVVAEDSHRLGYIASNQTDFVRSLTGEMFPYRCTAFIHDAEDEDDGHKFFVGFVYIVKK